MKFWISIASRGEHETAYKEVSQECFTTFDAVFDFLAARGHQTHTVTLIDAAEKPTLGGAQDEANFIIAYDARDDDGDVKLTGSNQCYCVMQAASDEKNVTFDEFKAARDAWAKRHTASTGAPKDDSDSILMPPDLIPVPVLGHSSTTYNIPSPRTKPGFLNYLYKALHPGNTLFISVVLTAIGIGLIGFGVACPPALVFAALGVAAFSAISAIGYAINWLKRDWNAYLSRMPDSTGSVSDYIRRLWVELWATDHLQQTWFMIAGAALFIGALIVTSCALAGVPLFAFMTAGAFGGAIGLVGSFFSAGFGSVSVSASVAALLTSIFTGAALIVWPTHILDTIRRAVSGLFGKNEKSHGGNHAIEIEDNPSNSSWHIMSTAQGAVRKITEGLSTFWGSQGPKPTVSTKGNPHDLGQVNFELK